MITVRKVLDNCVEICIDILVKCYRKSEVTI